VAIAVLALIGSSGLRDLLLPDQVSDSRVDQARQVIEDNYFRETDPSKLDDASIAGMVADLRKRFDDRFSHYFDPKTYKRFQASTSGRFSGVGMTITEVPKGLRVADVFENTPAAEAGIEMGDVVTAVEGQSIAGQDSEASAAEIKGPPGTEVELTIKDADTGANRDITVERAEVRIPAVEGKLERFDGKKIAYVALRTFSQGAHADLRAEIERLYRQGAEGLVLDLRGNGGGLLQEAVLVASIFIDSGPIVTTEGRTREKETLDAVGGALDERPMAVLVNGDTASASEIVTAALQEDDLATVVGTTTYGKGVFQEVIQLDGGAAIDLTVGEYLTADGTSILGTGVKPDIKVDDDDLSDGDDVLDAGLEQVAGELRGG
jgi:carboxyl-terminal processing protease